MRIPPPPPRLLELLAERRPLVAPLVLALREALLREAPKAQELVYSVYAVVDIFTFARPSDAFCHIVAYEKHVNLGFNQGALLNDPHQLLVGKGKRIRHIHIGTQQDLKPPLRHYIRAAVKQAIQPAVSAAVAAKRARLKGKRL